MTALFIAKTVADTAPGAWYHLDVTGCAHADCTGARLDHNSAPTGRLAAEQLCPACFTEPNLRDAAAHNNQRGWLNCDGARVDRHIGEALRIIEVAALEAMVTAPVRCRACGETIEPGSWCTPADCSRERGASETTWRIRTASRWAVFDPAKVLADLQPLRP